MAFIGDGSSDRMLLPPIRWLMRDLNGGVDILFDFVDLRGTRTAARTLSERIQVLLRQRGYDLLLVHRDTEKESPDRRRSEILEAVAQATRRLAESGRGDDSAMPVVPVVPVRMSEAWLLMDESAIRRAARNPRSTVDLDLPPASGVESIADPKRTLHAALVIASGLSGRRLSKFRPEVRVHDIQNWIDDWSALNEVQAFRRLRDDLRSTLAGRSGA